MIWVSNESISVRKEDVDKAIKNAKRRMESEEYAIASAGQIERDLLYDLGLWPDEEEQEMP